MKGTEQKRIFIAQLGGLNKVAEMIHENAVNHGLWEDERGLPEILMLCVAELAEALEEYRDGHAVSGIRYVCTRDNNVVPCECLDCCGKVCLFRVGDEGKCKKARPEGVSVELADCMIRILDYCGHAGIDIEQAIRLKHEYNIDRPYRHSGKTC